MSFKLGMTAKLYRNEATWESPTWSIVKHVRDLTLNGDHDEADVTTRDTGGWKASMATFKDGSVDFDIIWNPGDNAGFDALLAAWLNKTSIELAVMDGDILVPGAQGLHADFAVLKFSKQENLADAQKVSVTVKPTLSQNEPEWLVVAAS